MQFYIIGIPCPRGQIYQACANPCTYTCSEIAHSYSNCRDDCVEGCVCPPGQTLDVHGRCVPVSSCSCVHSGHMYPPEFLQRRGKEMWYVVKMQCLQYNFVNMRNYLNIFIISEYYFSFLFNIFIFIVVKFGAEISIGIYSHI